jgi:CDP-glucose 4,6-dehydratase
MDSKEKLKKFWKNKKVFITGHTGFKGSWLSIILNSLNSEIHGYSLKPKKNSLYSKSKIEKEISSNTYANINNKIKLKNKIYSCKPEIIFHLAAQPLVLESYKKPFETFNTNINGTLNLLECIREFSFIKSVVIITTDKVYKIDKKNKNYKETDELGGLDPYSSSKVGVEILVNSYIKSYFCNSNLKNRISTARAGNVIGGGDFSDNRLLPDIINSINNGTNLLIRNPGHIRPWQHVLDPLMGYLALAEKQYKNKITVNEHSWNFGPNKNSFKKVIDIVKYVKRLKNFKYTLKKNNKFKETNILKLNSIKAKNNLKWISKWNLNQSLENTIDWNSGTKNGTSSKNMCERQFLMYINKK